MSQQHLASSGRGGAGNFVDQTKSPKIQPKDLQTPTLKTPVFTTGRGGSGNMQKNVDASETRASQDVEPVTRQPSAGAVHSGRGGAGNILKGDEESANKAHQAKKNGEVLEKGHQENEGFAAKGKALLFGKKN